MKYTLYKSSFNHSIQNRNSNCTELFEDFLLFDCISFNIVGVNQPLLFLINEIGLNKVEELLERKSIEFITGIPLIAANLGSVLEGKQQYQGVEPLISGLLSSPHYSDPEFQIDETFKLILGLNRDRKRILKKIALDRYKIPKPKFSDDAMNLVLDAYLKNKLSDFGLMNTIEPENLGIQERKLLAELGYDIIETGILSQFNYKSNDNNRALKITKDSFDKIFNAFQVSNNNTEILRIENIPDLRNLYSLGKYRLSDVFQLRESKDAKKYREWINEKTDVLGDLKITEAYIDEITKENGFFNSNRGKLIKTISLFALSTYIGGQFADVPGNIVGLAAKDVLGKTVDLGLDFIDEYLLDGYIKGWNPRFFINNFRKVININ